MLESKDSKAAERAINKQRKSEEKRGKQAEKAHFQAIMKEIRFMVQENRAYGGEGLYAGFRFVEIADDRPSDDDTPYVGAFVPLQIAEKHPDVLLRKTLDIEEVLSDEVLPRGTNVVVAPGRLKPLRTASGCLGGLLVLVSGLAVLIAFT